MRRMQCPTTSLFRNTLSGFMFAELTTNTEMLHNFAISLDYKNSLKEFHFMIPLFFYPNECPHLYWHRPEENYACKRMHFGAFHKAISSNINLMFLEGDILVHTYNTSHCKMLWKSFVHAECTFYTDFIINIILATYGNTMHICIVYVC